MDELTTTALLRLLLAAAIGFAVAWLLRGLGARRWRERAAVSDRDLAARDQRLALLQGEADGLRSRLGNETAQAAATRTDLAETQAMLAAARTERDDQLRAVALWQQRLADAETRAAERERELSAARDAADARVAAAEQQAAIAAAGITRLSGEAERLAPLQDQLLAAREQNAEDARALGDCQARLRAVEADAAQLRAALEQERSRRAAAVAEHERRLGDADSAAARLRTDRDAWQQRHADGEARLKAALAAAGELGAWKSRCAELEVRCRAAEQAAAAHPAPHPVGSTPPPVDDLERIHGVGPKLSKLLNTLGVFRFRQVATWTEDDIDFFDRHLERFHGRIRRENWVASATLAHYRAYGEWLGADAPPARLADETGHKEKGAG